MPSMARGGRMPVCRPERLLPVDIHTQHNACMSEQPHAVRVMAQEKVACPLFSYRVALCCQPTDKEDDH